MHIPNIRLLLIFLYADEELEVDVNKITSIHTQLPFRYYELPFCRPQVIEDTRESLGEILVGDVIENSLYKVHLAQVLSSKVF